MLILCVGGVSVSEILSLACHMSHPRLGISTLAELRLEYLELLIKSLEFGILTDNSASGTPKSGLITLISGK